MTRSIEQLQRAAAETGFPSDGLEKVLNLLRLLDGFRAHPYLKTLLTDDLALQERLREHPALVWKAKNVRAHRGSP